MESLDNSATPVVSALSVNADMQERLVSENDVVSGAGQKALHLIQYLSLHQR